MTVLPGQGGPLPLVAPIVAQLALDRRSQRDSEGVCVADERLRNHARYRGSGSGLHALRVRPPLPSWRFVTGEAARS
jgi:hypothetical protein